jgi:phenylalanyl-tRNA synthetase beta chain
MLCFEGISRALNIFLGREKLPEYKLSKPEKLVTVTVQPETAQVRQYIAGAILRGVKFDQRTYDSFIALQDKLHTNICRHRSLVAMGTHDLRNIKLPITYEARKPEDIKFVPLNQTKEMTGAELMEFYEKDKNLGKYLHIIRDSPVYPAFYDADGNVLSMPPIINSERTKITLDTTDVFLDLSGTDKTKIEVVVNQLVAMFAQYTSEPFTIEPIQIISDHNNETRISPDISPRQTTAEVDYINSCLGLSLEPQEICDLLTKMSLSATPSATDKNILDVSVPITRSDILHQCDVMEDAAIGYGYNNLKRTFPSDSYTIAEALPINKVSDIVRREVAMSGWSEVMPLTLCSHDENFAYLNKKDDDSAVQLANPKTLEYQVVRTSLLPGILKTIRENRKHSLPIKVFESADVVFKDESLERKAFNRKHFGAVYAGRTSGFEIVHGLLGRIMAMLRAPWLEEEAKSTGRGYWIAPNDQGTFFPGRGATVYFRAAEGKEALELGTLGVLHPEVTAKFEIPYAASSLELNLELFL